MNRAHARPAALLAALLVLHGCGSTPPGEASGASALQNLDRGVCPRTIVDSRGRGSDGGLRYGSGPGAAELTALRERELGNCSTAVARGDTAALTTLVRYYDASDQTPALVSVVESYIGAGTDREALRNGGVYLYHTYSKGAPGVAADQGKAFRYLGVAVANGARELQLTYADELMQRSLFDDALRQYRALAADPGQLAREQRCDIYLNLGQLYFGASPGGENWNLGYYYWQQGLALADGAQWGSCVKDNFVYGERYTRESGRQKFVDQRLQMMSPAQRQVIDEARRDPSKGYAFVAELSFVRPANAPTAPTPQVTAAWVPGWPRWAPLDTPVCSMQSTGYPQSWSSVFDANGESIWTVESRNGNSRIQGSAVAVSPRELITNCHVIENPQQITLRRIGVSIPGRLKAADRQGDRCILQVDDNLPRYATLARTHTSVKVGEDVAAIGNPRGLETSLSRGIVAQKRARDGVQLIQTDAAISPGSSGGGLFDHSGNLIGITTFTISSGQSLNFAIAIDEFCR